jgi:hypothetical protein
MMSEHATPPTDLTSALRTAVAERDATHATWLAAASPPTPGNITVVVDADKAGKNRAAWHDWAAACRRVNEIEELAGDKMDAVLAILDKVPDVPPDLGDELPERPPAHDD